MGACRGGKKVEKLILSGTGGWVVPMLPMFLTGAGGLAWTADLCLARVLFRCHFLFMFAVASVFLPGVSLGRRLWRIRMRGAAKRKEAGSRRGGLGAEGYVSGSTLARWDHGKLLERNTEGLKTNPSQCLCPH